MEWFRNLITRITSNVEETLKSESDYIQMRLLVDAITEDFENKLRQRINENNIRYNIREANKEDIKSITKLYKLAWNSTSMPYHNLNEQNLSEMMEDPDIIFLIAQANSIDCGFALIYFSGRNNEVGVIAGLGVIPRFQHKGLGTLLGLTVWEYFKKRSVKELRCKVYKKNPKSYQFIKNLKFEEYDDDLVTWKF
ncbi:MAG: GNAT family N-acetyltransferase [Candidatus Thorarchaeota archaeon]